MVNSLQAQLLKAGLVDEKKLKQAQRAKKKAAKNEPDKVHDTAAAVEKARAEKAERDRQLNEQRKLESARKESEAQVKQIIEQAKIDRSGGETPYQFASKNKIKKIHVTPRLQQQLVSGVIAIVRFGEGYELVPASVADKIRQRDENTVVLHNTRSAVEPAEDDPYAEFQIPDDLMW